VLICHPEHPLGPQKSIKLKTTGRPEGDRFEPDIPTRKALDKILREHGLGSEIRDGIRQCGEP